MPGENGLSLARWMREAHPRVGLVMLTTASDTVDRVVGLELGADDYVPKPFEMRELLARVRAVLRRAETTAAAAAPAAAAASIAAPAPTRRVAFGACLLDLDERRLLGADAKDIDISAAEFDLLALFARHPNRPLNRDQIMEQAHNRGWDVFDRSIDLRIMRLRRKIERNPDKPELIKTVRNVGYVFVPAGER
jgi:two-component system phosphate regulon response regulator OmpR